MHRRDWLMTTGLMGAGIVIGRENASAVGAGGPVMRTEIKRLTLRHRWTTTMSSSDYRDTIYVHLERDGVSGVGEGAPIVRYNESAQSAQAAIESIRELVASSDVWHYEKILADAFARIEGEYAAKAALDIALLDWVGKRLGVPLHRFFGLDSADAPITTFSIGIDTPEMTRKKVLEAASFPVLKIKVGLDTDEQTIDAVRSVTDKPLRVDANEGWKSKEEAVRKINWLESKGVELVEQPLPAAMLEDMLWVKDRVGIPILADEACLSIRDIPRIAPFFDGVNVKVDKAGGLLRAHRMIHLAKTLGLKTMLGCMVSSSVAITAAAHLSPLVDYADLDGNLLISNDPYAGVLVRDGKLVLPAGPGLGLTPA